MKKILVIEDNSDIRENLAELLELQGHKALTASDGRQGVEQILNEIPDLVICDISMPELDGFQVLTIIQNNSHLSSIPFIFLTAKAEKSDIRRGLDVGALHYIVKPFTEDQLMNAVNLGLGIGIGQNADS